MKGILHTKCGCTKEVQVQPNQPWVDVAFRVDDVLYDSGDLNARATFQKRGFKLREVVDTRHYGSVAHYEEVL